MDFDISAVKQAKQLLMACNFVSVIACVFLMGWKWGAYGIMAAFTVSDILVMFCIYVLYAFRSRSIRPSAEDYLLVTDECDVSPGDVVELNIRTPSDSALAAEQLQLFCMGHGLDPKKSAYAALCTEETSNIFLELSAKAAEKKKKQADIRLYAVLSGERVRIQFRFYCRGISLLYEIDRLRESHEEFFSGSTGMQIVDRFSHEIKIFNSLDIDNWILLI